jgi:hypothetical protein
MKMLKRVLILLVLLWGGIFILSEVSWAVDPNVNTQLSNARSNGTNGNPGFDPCLGGTRDANGQCGGAATGLLKPSNLTTLFPTLGPGAVTDNMFGLITNVNAAGVTMDTTRCSAIGANTTTSSAALADPAGLQPGLNCGDIRFTVGNQGQTVPPGDNTLQTPTPIAMNTSMTADFCANAASDCLNGAGTQVAAGHTAFNFVNNFTWNRVSATSATTSLTQEVRQVTALKTSGIGTLAAPGTGDQDVKFTASFTGITSSNSVGSAGNPTVSWTQDITDPDQSGTSLSQFTQSIAGSFVYNSGVAGVFPTTQYPTGQSQTNGSTTQAQLPPP